jgi:hypothetical protein
MRFRDTTSNKPSKEARVVTGRRRFRAFIALLGTSLCAVLLPVSAHGLKCDSQTITGRYGFRLHELVLNPGTSENIPIGKFVPAAFAGQIVFHPTTRTVTGFRRGNEGGVPLNNTFNTSAELSTYSVEEDCTGTLKLILDDGSSRKYEIVITKGGAEIQFAVTSASFAVVGDGVAKKQPETCDTSTIAGEFGIRISRLLANSAGKSPLRSFLPADLVGVLRFDDTTTPPSASGHTAGTVDGNTSFASPLAGTYSVDTNCTGTLTLTDREGETKKLAMVIVKDEADIEIEFANTSQPADQIVGQGVGRKR